MKSFVESATTPTTTTKPKIDETEASEMSRNTTRENESETRKKMEKGSKTQRTIELVREVSVASFGGECWNLVDTLRYLCTPCLFVCGIAMRIFALFPPLLVLSIFGWGTFTYIHYLWIAELSIFLKLAMALAFFSMIFLSLSSYFTCFLAKHKTVPNEFNIPPELDLNDNAKEKERAAIFERLVETRKLPIISRSSFSNHVKYCRKCRILKPDRAHHCSQCNKCILKMDHHCIWVGNCVGYANYKSFVLFLFYTTILAVFTSTTTLPFVLQTWKTENRMNFTMLALMPGIISLSTAILFIFHLYLLGKNQTTVETYQIPGFVSTDFAQNKYSLGFSENFLEIFGQDPCDWLWPWGPGRGDGIMFPVRVQGQIYRNPTALIVPRKPSVMDRIQEGDILTENSDLVV